MNSRGFKGNQRSRSPTFRRKNFHNQDRRKSDWVPQEEWDRRRREGKCLKCGSGDHMTRQCPKTQTVSSSNRGPPGIRSNNVEVSNIEETERLRTLAETTECANEIELAALELNSEIEYTASEVSTYATCIEIPDTESDEEPADVDNLHETTSSKDSQIERPHDVSFDWETEDKRSKQHTCDPGLVGRFYHVPDNDCIAIPPRSPGSPLAVRTIPKHSS
ncbi:hypothetical protein AGABI1DRAFT_134581 [Agaricus bisporus var. burnettii JB137-S8]|uniref:CCHC-type domain-containing protein n=1 Tax=Agaricus bisporus var. burnettii (strain JB137-S8 / ATCC MYA-4627 / FGSC 10392) TaxID=597362 RepID=K5WSL5_AGABU|nr:uncharacterized protein AGABI1DRAFT_134581 [Agaricus bisporus var. burnettii JB137-S8]EKM73532.1 hypothetical protein AGABI1DRAFT_134581 [Agaricus bisporus var. burnettii JB137-S8]